MKAPANVADAPERKAAFHPVSKGKPTGTWPRMTNSLPRPAFVLWCAALVALGSQQPAEAANNDPYLVVQHQVYEEHQEVIARNASKRNKGSYRKDDDELFDFIKDYLFRRGGALKLRSRSSDGKAQFMGVDASDDDASPAKRDSAESDRRYKMHIIKFRLVNRSDPAVAGGARRHGFKAKAARKQGTYAIAPHGPRHRESGDEGTHVFHYGGHRSTGRTAVAYTSSHPTHETTSSEAPPPPRGAPAAAGNCELPETTTRSTTRRTTTTKKATTTSRTTTKTTTKTTTTTTPKKTTRTTTTTTSCASTTVNVVGCDRPAPTSTKTTTSTTTTTSPKPYLHGHPFVVIKMHEVPGTPPSPTTAGSSSSKQRVWGHRVSSDTQTLRRHNDSLAHFAFFGHRPHGSEPESRRRSRRYPSYAAETAALKREVAGNLMHVLRTIRQLDQLAQEPQQEGDAPPNPELDVDRLLTARERHKEPSIARKKTTEFPDELRENEMEEGDLHQFSLLLKKALDEMGAPTTTRRSRTR